MGERRAPYAPESRRQRVEWVRSGRTPGEMAREWRFCCLPKGDRSGAHRRQSATGCVRPIARSCGGCGGRCARFAKSGNGDFLVCRRETDSKPSRGLVRWGDRDGAREDFERVRANRAAHQVATMYRVRGVSSSGSSAWRGRERSRHARRDEELRGESGRFTGVREGLTGRLGLMPNGSLGGRRWAASAWRGGCARKGGRGEQAAGEAHHAPGAKPACGGGLGRTTLPRRGAGPAPGGRHHPRFHGGRLDVATWAGLVFLAVGLDGYSRRIVGWAMQDIFAP